MERNWCEQIHFGEDDSGRRTGGEKQLVNLKYMEAERQGRRVNNGLQFEACMLGQKVVPSTLPHCLAGLDSGEEGGGRVSWS